MEGRCQCGLVKFTCPLSEPLKLYICHCTECQHQSSSAFGMSARFPIFEIPDPGLGADEPAIGIYHRQTLSGRQLRCYFCRRCGSRLQHKAPGDKSCSIKAGCLTGLRKDHVSNAIHIWTREAVIDIPKDAVEQWEEEPRRG